MGIHAYTRNLDPKHAAAVWQSDNGGTNIAGCRARLLGEVPSSRQRGSILQVAITCRHGSIDDDTRAYITRKCEKLVHHFERVTEIDVTVDFEGDGDRVSVEILVDAEHKHNFVASVESKGDASHVFDSTLHKMDRQIRRHKQKLQDHRRDKPTHELTKNPLDD